MGTTRRPFPTSRKQQSVAIAKHSTTRACVMSMAEAPPGTLARYRPPLLSPDPSPVPREMSRGQDVGKASLSPWHLRGKHFYKALTSRDLDSKLR